MLSATDMHEYQQHAVNHIMENEASALFMDMGLGKSCTTLTAIDQLLHQYLDVSRVLVIAPKRVAGHTWTAEASKWAHLKHLKISRVMGTERQRIEALRTPADIYTIGRDNIVWLVAHYAGAWPFDMVVIDELSSFKNHQAKRFRALRQIRPQVSRIVGLTGTPAPNGLIDLWAQLFLLDQGERLGKTIGGFRERYFTPGKRSGHVVFDYKPRNDTEQTIYERIGDICISMKASDYLQLPGRVSRIVEVQLPDAIRKKYQAFEREQVLAMEDADDISVANAAALSNKLMQFANGAVYDADRNVHLVHDEKLDALEEIIEAANGKPVLVAYSFKHDCTRILERLKAYKPVKLSTDEDIERWNRGEISVLIMHPASGGHGLNLQSGGNTIVWFGPTWSLELYQQLNARLDRQGQDEVVMIHHLVCPDTMDVDAMAAIEGKTGTQDALMNAVKARVRKYLKTA